MNASASWRSRFAIPSTTVSGDRRSLEAPLPRYDYRCVDEGCENDTFEVSKSYTDNSATACPVCNTEAKRLLSPIAVHFKGSGFYVTDNRASNGASGSDSDSGSSEKGSESKSDSKSEKKSDSKSSSDSGTKTKAESKSSSGDSNSKSKAVSSAD